jgi:hypothetical protein
MFEYENWNKASDWNSENWRIYKSSKGDQIDESTCKWFW